MRRLLFVAGVVFVAGCNNFRDLFSAHADVAAEAEGQALKAERLAEIMGTTKGLQLTRDAADLVANTWIDYTLLAQALVQGENLSDSAAVAEMMWPQIAVIKSDRLFDSLLSHRLNLGDKAADSLYNAGELRLLQHILYGVPSTAERPVREEALRQAQATLAKIRAGASFGALALTESQDVQSARDSGYLSPSPRGAFVTAFDSAGWSLAPGTVSGIVETPFGYHIIRRPDAAEARARLIAFMQDRTSGTLDSLYRDSLALARGVEVTSGAVAAMRAALADPESQRTSDKKIVTYKGGGFTVADFLRWVYAVPPQLAQQLPGVADEQLKEFARILTQNTLLLDQADSLHIGLTPLEWASIRQQYGTEMDSLRVILGLGASLTDTSVAATERAQVAALRVDGYFSDLLTGKTRLRRIPASLSSWLRRHGEFRLNQAGLIRSVELAAVVKARADSATTRDSTRPAADSGRTQPPAGR